jgi:fatty-acyl-CoA synthase
LERPEETAKAFTADGWLKSGDIGRRDADGCYYVAGRIKEMYISGGENVYPAEIENCARTASSGARGRHYRRHGRKMGRGRPRLRPCSARGAAVSAAEVIQFCRAGLAGYKTPRHVTFVADFPRTAAGKIKKHELAPPAPSPSR